MAPSTAVTAKPRAATDGAADPLLYRVLRVPVRRALERFFEFRVEGLQHVPPRGPYIVAANHHNYLDGVVLAVAAPVAIGFLVMPRVWRATPLHPLLHRHLGSIPLTLERPDVGALRAALAALDAGRVVGIFPEGPFSVRGRLERALPGVGLLALRSGVPIVPAAIRGTYEALTGRRFYVPRRQAISVRFGAPRAFGPARAGSVRRTRQEATDRIMADIAALLA